MSEMSCSAVDQGCNTGLQANDHWWQTDRSCSAKLGRETQARVQTESSTQNPWLLLSGAKPTYQDRAVLPLEDGKLVGVLAVLNSLHNVSKLGIDVGGATHSLQAASGLLNLATVHQAVGGVRDDETAQEEDEGRHDGQTHR